MKTSLRKLRGFALHGRGEDKEHEEQRDVRSSAKLDELAQASRDMEDMRDCYDSLLSAAAATANSAYEFSESLREMGSCLLEKTALNDDEESGKVLLMLGKTQFELDKLIDAYRSHIFKTITIPSESLLNELRTVEEMKRLCDEKRDVYKYMSMKHREKARAKSGKGESFTTQQIQVARDEYDEEATMFVFRVKSLKQGQSRSLLTQAARHHAAQSFFFKNALKSLEAVEPHVKLITERQHIDYLFSGLDDDDGDDYYDDDEDDEDDNSSDAHDDGELSFDYGQNDRDPDTASTSRNSMELDMEDVTFPQVLTVEAAKENLDERRWNSYAFNREIKAGSQSAPLFAEKKLNDAGKLREMRPSLSRKLHSYVLPIPVDTKRSISTGSVKPALNMRQSTPSAYAQNLSHSSPLNSNKHAKTVVDGKFSGSIVRNAQSVLKESNINTESSRLPPPLADGLLYPQLDPFTTSYSKKFKRQAFSGPLSNKPWSNKTVSNEHPRLFSGPILRNPTPQPLTSPKVSSSASPPFVSSPKISELHELPRPPISSTLKSPRSLGLMGYSGPLVSRGQEHSTTRVSTVSNAGLLLPTPAQSVSRSLSVSSSGSRATVLQMSNPAEAFTVQRLLKMSHQLHHY